MHEIGNSVPPEVPCQGQLATLGTGRVGALRDVGVTEVPHPSKVGALEIVQTELHQREPPQPEARSISIPRPRFHSL